MSEVKLLDSIEQYAAAVEQDVRAKLRFTSYARRNSARDKRHLKHLAMRANLAERDAEVEALRAELRKRDAEWNRTAGEAVARAERLAEALREASHAGALLANIAYNLEQDESLSEPVRRSLGDARKRWDLTTKGARTALQK